MQTGRGLSRQHGWTRAVTRGTEGIQEPPCISSAGHGDSRVPVGHAPGGAGTRPAGLVLAVAMLPPGVQCHVCQPRAVAHGEPPFGTLKRSVYRWATPKCPCCWENQVGCKGVCQKHLTPTSCMLSHPYATYGLTPKQNWKRGLRVEEAQFRTSAVLQKLTQ